MCPPEPGIQYMLPGILLNEGGLVLTLTLLSAWALSFSFYKRERSCQGLSALMCSLGCQMGWLEVGEGQQGVSRKIMEASLGAVNPYSPQCQPQALTEGTGTPSASP